METIQQYYFVYPTAYQLDRQELWIDFLTDVRNMINLSSVIESSLQKDALTPFHLSRETIDLLNDNFQRLAVRKRNFLIQDGNKEQYVYFVESGILRCWTLDVHLQEITFGFSFAGEFVNSYYSFCKNTKSEFNIQTLTDCVIWRIEKRCLFNLFQSSLEINILARVVMENVFTKKTQREIELLKYTIEERYRLLITRDKNMLKDIPLKYIASYLGATPQSLSRIRKKIVSL